MPAGRLTAGGQVTGTDCALWRHRSRLRQRRPRGSSAEAGVAGAPGGCVDVTIVAPPGSLTTVWNEPSGSRVVVDPSGLTTEKLSAVSPADPAGAASVAGSAGAVQAAGPASAAVTGSAEAAGSIGSADGVVVDAVSSVPVAGTGSTWAAPGKKKLAGASSCSLMARNHNAETPANDSKAPTLSLDEQRGSHDAPEPGGAASAGIGGRLADGRRTAVRPGPGCRRSRTMRRVNTRRHDVSRAGQR
jgi:hypothetical protein